MSQLSRDLEERVYEAEIARDFEAMNGWQKQLDEVQTLMNLM